MSRKSLSDNDESYKNISSPITLSEIMKCFEETEGAFYLAELLRETYGEEDTCVPMQASSDS